MPPLNAWGRVLLGVTTAAALLTSVAGCSNTCDRMCTAQADLIERCSSTWGSTWEDLSYSGRTEYLERCSQVWGEALNDLDEDSEEWDSLSNQCDRELETALSDTDCESLLSIDP